MEPPRSFVLLKVKNPKPLSGGPPCRSLIRTRSTACEFASRKNLLRLELHVGNCLVSLAYNKVVNSTLLVVVLCS